MARPKDIDYVGDVYFPVLRTLKFSCYSRQFFGSKAINIEGMKGMVYPTKEMRSNVSLREEIAYRTSVFLIENGSNEKSTAVRRFRELNSIRKKRLNGVLAFALLLLTLPLLVVCALAIKLESRGPIFFSQNRTGFMGRRFKMYKLRTMVEDADALKGQLEHLNFHSDLSPDFKIKNDPRVTRVGMILRKFSLDELPQLWNVVKGDMRLVGPRPTSFSADTYDPAHLSRLAVFPGLTGIWQISGRSNVKFEERVKLDCKYILECTTILDMKILLKTPLAVVRSKGAY